MTEPYGVGTVTVANGGTTVTGTSTFWVGKVRKNDLFTVPAQGLFARVTADPTENDELAINGWPGTDLVDAEYEIISTYIAVDTASRTRELLLGLSLIDPNYDAQVDTQPDRVAYDDKPGPTPTTRGFAVLVSDIGDGSSAIYSKQSNATADWSAPAPYSGPTGAKGWSPNIVSETDGERRVLKLAGYVGGEGTAPTANVGKYFKADGTWTDTIGDAADFRGEGFIFRGAYSGATDYAKGNVAREAGSSWIALQPTTGNAPPIYPTTANDYWALLAAKGQDGTGTGDVVGPASAIDERIAVWDGLTGKLLKDGGKTINELVPVDNSVTNAILANMATATFKARASAGTGDPEDLTASQALSLLKAVGAYAKDNILGTVSQSAGVPTGAVVEQGSNANGRYVRFADGTQMCWRLNLVVPALTQSAGAIFQGVSNVSWTFPAAFTSGTVFVTPGYDNEALWGGAAISGGGGTTATLRTYYHTSNSGGQVMWAFAIGRWI